MGSTVARLSASGPLAPFGQVAIARTCEVRTHLIFDRVYARAAAVLGRAAPWAVQVAGAHLSASSTSSGTRAPLAWFRKDTVDRARICVAGLFFTNVGRAGISARSWVGDDMPGSCLGTATTVARAILTARAPSTPLRHLAVHWACAFIARLTFSHVSGARGTAKLRRSLHCPSCSFMAIRSARRRARSPGTPPGHLARDRTRYAVAGSTLRHNWAFHAAISRIGTAHTGAGLHACLATGYRACRPWTPNGDNAVNWTRIVVTDLMSEQVWARLTAGLGRLCDRPSTGVTSSATGLCAKAVS